MASENHTQLASFIWSICNLLRGPYKRNEYRKVILPLTVLRRFDCILEPTKAAVLKEHAAIKAKPENIIRHKLCSITGHAFYNLSKLPSASQQKAAASMVCSTTRTSSDRISTATSMVFRPTSAPSWNILSRDAQNQPRYLERIENAPPTFPRTNRDCRVSGLGELVGKVETAVERLQEYRTALITAAVTGKIDVRAVTQ